MDAKGVSDLRTAITRKLSSKPPRKGTAYLDLYALSLEKQRLEKQLFQLEKRKKHLLERLGEVEREISRREQAARSSAQETSFTQPEGQWKKIVINY